MSKINFVLPPNIDKAIGGYKIVYQYANELIKRGEEVSIVHLFRERDNQFFSRVLKSIDHKVHYSRRSEKITWFNLDSRIKVYYDVVSPKQFPDADFVIATSMHTTGIVSRLTDKKGKKFYFIQDYETERFGNTVEEVEATYRLGFENIVISNELKEIVTKASGIEPNYLPNFYDHDEFFLEKNIENRPNCVSLINHVHETKRTKFGLELLKEVKKVIPDLTVELFGAYDPVCEIEDYVHFTLKADPEQLRTDIYGKSKVYLLPSTREGWVLTGMEAMASGAAVIASRIGGIIDYANDENSILVEPDDKEEFIAEIINLLKNDEKQLEIARRGNSDVQQYSMEKSGELLMQIIKSEV